MNIATIKKVYFLGIGGIGMSALARYFLHQNKHVLGYDRTSSVLTKQLEQEGASIQYTEDVGHLPQDIDLVIWTPAIPSDSVLLQYFRSNDFVLKKRSEVLGILSRDLNCLAVAGTHGKTTVTTLLTHLLTSAGKSPSAFLGGISLNYGGNFASGNSGTIVLEADEYDRSFLKLFPNRLIVTSMDPDHLDIYGTHDEMLRTYLEFCRQVYQNGSIHIHHSLKPYFEGWNGAKVMTYGVDAGDIQAKHVRVEEGYMVFDLILPHGAWKSMKLPFPGKHNVENAVAALSIAWMEHVSEEACRSAMLSFKGIHRRFERIAEKGGRVYIDDYAHHPAELSAAIQAARLFYPGKKILGIFQPHLYSRTRDFQAGFAASLDLLDECILLDIYPARELPIEGVDAQMIADQMNLPHTLVVPGSTLIEVIQQRDFEVLMTLGAGDIDRFIENIKEEIFGE